MRKFAKVAISVLFVALLIETLMHCSQIERLERELREVKSEVYMLKEDRLTASDCGKPFRYGRYTLYEVTSLYAQDGGRWLPVYTVTEVTTNMPPCRSIDRTGLWYAPVGGIGLNKMKDEYVPPRPLWEVE